MLRKILYSVMRKIKQKGQGVRRAVFENSLRKNWAEIIFLILTKDFLVNGNYFPFDHYFIVKQTPANLNTFSEKYFTAKQTEP